MSLTSDRPHLSAPTVEDVLDLYIKRNPRRRDLAARKGELSSLIRAFLREVTAQLDQAVEATSQPIDPDAGEGLAEPLAPGQGARWLEAYATPMALESWAGETAGAGELTRRYGVPRSTLHDWQKRNAVIGLLSGRRKHVFPMAQFIDGRPVEGLPAVVEAAGSPRTAWLWLVEPHPSLGAARPLDRLRQGQIDRVVDLAARDFAQS